MLQVAYCIMRNTYVCYMCHIRWFHITNVYVYNWNRYLQMANKHIFLYVVNVHFGWDNYRHWSFYPTPLLSLPTTSNWHTQHIWCVFLYYTASIFAEYVLELTGWFLHQNVTVFFHWSSVHPHIFLSTFLRCTTTHLNISPSPSPSTSTLFFFDTFFFFFFCLIRTKKLWLPKFWWVRSCGIFV